MKKTPLHYINKISNACHDKNKIFSEDFPEELTETFSYLKEYFKLDDEIAIQLFCICLEFKLNKSYIYFDIDDFTRFSSGELSGILAFAPSFDKLFAKKYFVSRNNFIIPQKTLTKKTQWDIDNKLVNRIVNCEPPETEDIAVSSENLDLQSLILYSSQISDTILKDYSLIYRDIMPFYSNSEECRKFIDDLDRTEIYSLLKMFFVLSKPLAAGNLYAASLANSLSDIYSASDIVEIQRNIKEGKNTLFAEKYFKLLPADMNSGMSYEFGEKILEIFEGQEYLLCLNNKSKELKKIEIEKIAERHLYYNEKNQKDIDRLENIVSEEKYQEIRSRLEEKGLSKALNIVLFGPPGTGKTETVMQTARKAGRGILQLNISEIRSCWVGETESNIKRVFEAYKDYKSKLKPILFFNEADAILNKRTDTSLNPAVEKEENSMQNIILQELENFDGIFIATSNLVKNMDPAFERRFLYKIELENPTTEVKEKIIKDKIPELDEESVKYMSKNYDFSGGQIDNISKKVEIDYILYGNKPTKDTIIDFCEKEKFNDESRKRIGFEN